MKPIAIVTPWFGANLTGGAEQQAFQIATRLADRQHIVEVLTTCNISFDSDWETNYHPTGVTEEFGLTIRRFPVDDRASEEFDRVNAKLLSGAYRPLRPGVSPVSREETETFINENIKSVALLEFLRTNGTAYQALIFLPYMFFPTTHGIPLVAERAWLQPCLHDEPQAYFPQVAALFRAAKGVLFNSAGEFELAMRLYGPGIYSRSTIVGEGIEPSDYPNDVLCAALPTKLRDVRFVLYLGRRDRLKNVDLLVEAFARFKKKQPESRLQLVLAGTGSETFASLDSIIEIGFVAGELKAALLANCVALAQPSANESFSRVLMEAWAAGRPAAVNGDCLATAKAVQHAGGGWTPRSLEQWTDLFEELEFESSNALDELGRRGRLYASKHADWDQVISRYEAVLGLNADENGHVRPVNDGTRVAIHQLLPDFVYGDAISNQARTLRDILRRLGYSSEIFCKRSEPRFSNGVQLVDECIPEAGAALIYHYGIGSDITTIAVSHRGPKMLVYHNITPAAYFTPYRPGFAWMLEVGRNSLKRLAGYFSLSVGDSSFNASELKAHGFSSPRVLPIIIDPDRWNIEPAEQLLQQLQDGRTNILFTGRLAPNKRPDRLLEAFAEYLKLDSEARLIIAGESRLSDPYTHQVHQRCRDLRLQEHVEMPGQIGERELLAYYLTGHLYWSLSEHEGFGAPLVEAMWFDIPVLALNKTAIAETLGGAGALYDDDEPLTLVARRAYELINSANRRHEVIEKQRRRRADFTPDAVAPKIRELCELLESSHRVETAGIV